jgi:predicted O-methyltransferase YrrM
MFTYEDIPNHFSFADVYDLAIERFPSGSTFVEVGTWFGASAAYLATKVRSSGKRITIFAVDNFTAEGSRPPLRQKAMDVGGNFYHIFRDNLERCGVLSLVTPIISDSTEAATQFEDRSLDFVFIDASHEYRKVNLDIDAWLPKVKAGGILAGHDYDPDHPQVIRAVDEHFGPRGGVAVMTHSWLYYKKVHV